MLATLAAALFAVSALAADTTPVQLSNHLDVEVAMQSQGLVSESTGVVFAYGENSESETRTRTVGFSQVASGNQVAIYRSAPESRLCTRVEVDADLASDASLSVYNARGENLESDSAQIVFGRDAEGRTSMAVWLRPGETVTSVSAVDHRSGNRRARTELRRGSRTLTLAAEGEEAVACSGR